ncbi:hypothetical protein ABK040_014145 [Willaertia magna]
MSMRDFGLPMSFGGGRRNNSSSSNDKKKGSNNKISSALNESSKKESEKNSNTPTLNDNVLSVGLRKKQQEQQPAIITTVRHFEDVSDDEEEITTEESSTKELIPITKVVKMKGHSKSVTAISIDPSGSRLISGSSDYAIKFWDFQGMDESLQSFRSIDEISDDGSYSINHLVFSNSGDKFILADNSIQAILYDRDGYEQGKFKKGDRYIVDMGKTSGHISSWTGVQWHPDQNNRFVVSSSLDSTVRIWDMEYFETKQKTVLKARNSKGMKTRVSSCCYNTNGNLICGGCMDGSIQIWKESNTSKAELVYRDGDNCTNAYTCVVFSNDDNYLVGRDDNTLKIFDLRQFKKPLNVFEDLPNLFENTNCIFSPLGDYIITPVSSRDEEDNGSVVFIDWKENKIVNTLPFEKGISPIQVRWHPILNQLFIAGTDNHITGCYDPEKSIRGLVTSMSRPFRRKNIDQIDMIQPQIIAPYAPPMYKDANAKKTKKRKDPRESHVPTNPPPKGPGFGGRVTDSFTHFLVKGMGIIKGNEKENARDAILRHAEEAEKNPKFISPAYQKTQPTPIFDYEGLDKEIEEEEEKQESSERFDTKKRKKQ